jgi:type IV secretion system protein VirD4
MLELYDRKLSRTVLRRESGSNSADLAGTIFGGFAPNSQTAEVLSKALGSRTVLSGSISKGKNDPSQSLQMIERPLMTLDELKSIPKGQFVVMKTGSHPMRTRLRLFLDWGITFGELYILEEKAARTVSYANKQQLENAVFQSRVAPAIPEQAPPGVSRTGKAAGTGRWG